LPGSSAHSRAADRFDGRCSSLRARDSSLHAPIQTLRAPGHRIAAAVWPPRPLPVATMPRRHDIDALRVIAFALLIVYHVGMVYVAEWGFHVKSDYQAEWLQWPMIALNRWRMPLLFMISGIALGLARIDCTPWRFAARRCWRLLLPLAFGMFVVVAVQAYCEGLANGRLEPGFGAFLLRYWQLRPWPPGTFTGAEFGITWNHLWYLAYLWLYTMLLVALLPLRRLRTAQWLAGRHWPTWLLLSLPRSEEHTSELQSLMRI